jgi:hypothetical protein
MTKGSGRKLVLADNHLEVIVTDYDEIERGAGVKSDDEESFLPKAQGLAGRHRD